MKPKTNYIINVPLVHGEITVVTADHAEDTMRHSARLANAIKDTGLNVLAINCGMSDKRYRGHFYEAVGRESFRDPKCIIKSSVCGNLIGEREAIDQIVDEARIAVVILSGWEFASSSSRRRHRLLFYLRELMERENVAVIIYAHSAKNPVAGIIDHGGIGKLSFLAHSIAELDSSQSLEKSVKKMKVVTATPAEERAMKEGAQLVANKIIKLGMDGRELGKDKGEGMKDERVLMSLGATCND
jgi:hypothetical protein